MDSIYGNSIKPQEKTKTTNQVDFDGKWVGGYRWGIGFGSPDVCECFRYAPDAGSADILKNHKTRKLRFLRENGFRKNNVFYCIKTTNREDQNDRKNHTKISCFHKNLT